MLSGRKAVHEGSELPSFVRLAITHAQHAGHAQALLEHGRLRYDQLLRYVAEQQDAREAELAGTVEACFLRLLAAQQVERAPSCDLRRPWTPRAALPRWVSKSLFHLTDSAIIPQVSGHVMPMPAGRAS